MNLFNNTLTISQHLSKENGTWTGILRIASTRYLVLSQVSDGII